MKFPKIKIGEYFSMRDSYWIRLCSKAVACVESGGKHKAGDIWTEDGLEYEEVHRVVFTGVQRMEDR